MSKKTKTQVVPTCSQCLRFEETRNCELCRENYGSDHTHPCDEAERLGKVCPFFESPYDFGEPIDPMKYDGTINIVKSQMEQDVIDLKLRYDDLYRQLNRLKEANPHMAEKYATLRAEWENFKKRVTETDIGRVEDTINRHDKEIQAFAEVFHQQIERYYKRMHKISERHEKKQKIKQKREQIKRIRKE